jgi:hypothetical protein
MNRKNPGTAKNSIKRKSLSKLSATLKEVVNSRAKTIPAKDPRPLGWEPMFCGNSLPFSAGQKTIQTTGAITSPTLRQVGKVPAGKRLVIEFIAVEIDVPIGQYVHLAISSKLGNASAGFRITLDKIQNINGNDLYVTSQPASLYVDENRTVDIYVSRYPSTGTGQGGVMCSGHLENMS